MTRENIADGLGSSVDLELFGVAQKRVYAMMEADAYRRFLQSQLYNELLTAS